MGFFNHNDYKYIIKRIIILIFAFLIFSGLKSVFGYTDWEAPNGKTYRIPETGVMQNAKYVIMVAQNKNNNTFQVYKIQASSACDYLYMTHSSNSSIYQQDKRIMFEKLPYDSVTETFSGEFYHQIDFYQSNSLPGNSNWSTTTGERVAGFSREFLNDWDYYIYDCSGILNFYESNPIKDTSPLYTYWPTSPIITTSVNDIENWSFENITVDLNGIVPDGIQGNISDKIVVRCFNGQSYTSRILSVNDFITWNSDGGYDTIFDIPYMNITAGLYFSTTNDIEFTYIGYMDGAVTHFTMGTYTVNLTDSQVALINEDSDRYNQIIQMEEAQKTNDLLTDTNFNSEDIALPTMEFNDNGVINMMQNIFTSFYNAFTSGSAVDIVLPIPFTNKNITVPSDYTYNMLNDNGASWLITLIQLFWWYFLGVDVLGKVFGWVVLIMQGNIDRMQSTNVTTKLL